MIFCSISLTIFVSYFLKLAEIFSKDGMSFLASCQNLVPRPWVIDDLDTFKLKWSKKSWKKAGFMFSFIYPSLFSMLKLLCVLILY